MFQTCSPIVRTVVFVLILTRGLTAQGIIEGRVELANEKSAPVLVKRYDIVSKGGVITTNPFVAVVYVEGKFADPTALPVMKVDQKDYLFVPALLPVRRGTKVEFPNLDNTYHDVFSYSEPKRFDLGRYRPGETPSPSQVFDKPGLITLRCDIHEHMRGIILVLDTPHFVTTGTDGKFKLSGLPAGKFKLKAWLNSRTTLEKPVDIKNGATLQVNFP